MLLVSFYGYIINKTVTRSAPLSLPCFLVQHCPSGKTETPENGPDAASGARAFRFLFYFLIVSEEPSSDPSCLGETLDLFSEA